MLPPPPCTCTELLCCEITLVTDLPDSIGNMWALLSSRVQKKKTNKKNKIVPKIYVLQCTSYVVGMYISYLKKIYLRCSSVLYELCLARIRQKSQPPPSPPKKSTGI